MASPALILAIFLLTLTFATPLHAQEDDGASLTIAFTDGATTFHVGEIIRVELSFRALVPDAYDISTRSYDRSGRLDLEQFHLSPPGRDPLEDYYSFGWFAGGGLGSEESLTSKPHIVQDNLNEWVALDKPGHYSLYVTSRRVGPHRTTGEDSMELRSNTLEFDVVAADAAWQQQALSSALATLNMDSATKDEKAAALQALRYLDTPDSARELVRLLSSSPGDGDWDEMLGLAGSPYQSVAVGELERVMSDPDAALTGNYIYILARLKFLLERKPLPPYPENDAQAQKDWQKQSDAQDKQFSKLQDALYAKAATLAAGKFGAAQAETVRALLEESTATPEDDGGLASVSSELIASAFLNLSEDEQWDLLTSAWERLKIPAMVAPLEKVAKQPDMQNARLRGLALFCLYELGPDEGRPIFLEEMQHPHVDDERYTVTVKTLGLLPDRTLPQFDEMLANRLAQKDSATMELDASLTGRYATKAVLARVKNIYERSAGQWDCVEEDGFVMYFLRVDPDYGVKRLAVAPSTCMENSLPMVVTMKRWNEVEPGIIARMNGPDLWRAGQAAQALAKYGDVGAEKAIWERLLRLNAQWAGREDELAVYRPDMKKDASEAMELEDALVQALGTAQAWLLTNGQINTLESLTSGLERENVKQWRWSSPVELDVTFLGHDQMQANIHQYCATDMPSLVSKLEQYPQGTEFRLNMSGPQDKVATASTMIEDAAANHGLQIEGPALSN